jgi:uncharacterized membrane protein YgcG
MPILRRAPRAFTLVVAVSLGLAFAPHAAADCTPEEWIDLCQDGGRTAYYPCVCNYMNDAESSIDIDRPADRPNRPDNSLPGTGRPGGGGGGGGPVVIGGGGRGGGGRR